MAETGRIEDVEDVVARAAEARALAARMRARALERAAATPDGEAEARLNNASRVPGTVLRDEIVPPGPWSATIAKGHHLRIIDLAGQQAVDFLCYDRAEPLNRYNAGNTIKVNGQVHLSAGMALLSEFADVLMTIEADTIGHHDTIAGCCSAPSNYRRYGIAGTPNCRDNFIAGLTAHGLSASHLAANVNFFMYVPVLADGTTAIAEGLSRPGDYVDLRAARDVLVVISNCPQQYNPCNGWNPTPVRLIEWRPA
jgi:urea carboxylase-associated protein 1